jgi:hypothetical protein
VLAGGSPLRPLRLALVLLALAAPLVAPPGGATEIGNAFRVTAIRESDGATFFGHLYPPSERDPYHANLWLFALRGNEEVHFKVDAEVAWWSVVHTPESRTRAEWWSTSEGSGVVVVYSERGDGFTPAGGAGRLGGYSLVVAPERYG